MPPLSALGYVCLYSTLVVVLHPGGSKYTTVETKFYVSNTRKGTGEV